MSLLCQVDSYLRETTAQVTAITQSSATTYAVTLSDTILFPEGGGQPCDHGTIAGLTVDNVQTDAKSQETLHTVHCSQPSLPFAVGDSVAVVLDWRRRFDHMQQHSGQHLITAVADLEFGFKTVSWSLG